MTTWIILGSKSLARDQAEYSGREGLLTKARGSVCASVLFVWLTMMVILALKATWQSAAWGTEKRRFEGEMDGLTGWSHIVLWRVCLFVLLETIAKRKIHQVGALQPSTATLPRGSCRFPGAQSKLRVTPDLLTSAVSALIKAESTQCAPRSFAPVHTIFALSAFTAHAQLVTYAEVHTVEHHADPEPSGGRKLCHLWLLHLAS